VTERNAQYNLAKPDSLSNRVATRMRTRISLRVGVRRPNRVRGDRCEAAPAATTTRTERQHFALASLRYDSSASAERSEAMP
jgi:hypothetical protein